MSLGTDTNPAPAAAGAPRTRARGAAALVALGILLSRIAGLVRQRVFAHYFANSAAAGAFTAALRIPNFLQNLFGEGALSASFIPVYAGLLARADDEEAGRVAGAIGALLALSMAALVLVGVLGTPWLVDFIAPGFEGGTRALTIRLVRILFPGVGLLVLSAWCLGILNSHRQFFLSYAAPVVWNAAMIAALVAFGSGSNQEQLAVALAWGAVVGSVLQFAVQVPAVLRLATRLRPALDTTSVHVRTVLRNFLPAFVSRGVVQISAFVDSILASLISASAVAALGYAQPIYTLPVSLFGLSVSAAELPAMASAVGSEGEIAAHLRRRLNDGLQRISFFVVPSATALFALGDVIAGALYQTGRFGRADAEWVWGILAGSAIGLLASTLGRLYSSAYYALRDTRTPLRFAFVRVALTTALGYALAVAVPPALGLDPKWGAAGLTASAGVAGWVEFVLLRRSMNARIGATGVRPRHAAVLWAAAGAAAAAAWAVKLALGPRHPLISAGATLGVYALVYGGITSASGVREARLVLARLTRRPGR
jgi:putative peptidoglycan lipid II flippase